MMFRLLRGIQFNEETIAENVIRHVGPGGHFLAQEHTRRNYTAEHFIPQIFDREPRDTWERSGSKDSMATAKAQVKALLAEHELVSLDKSTSLRLQEILDNANKHMAKL